MIFHKGFGKIPFVIVKALEDWTFIQKSAKLFIILRQVAEYLGFAYDISNSWKRLQKAWKDYFIV
jgi:hypothetical protein